MAEILESVMLFCFGVSWPISVINSIKSKSTKGKSALFLITIILGYVAGITAKLLLGAVNYVLAIYFFNLIAVSVDLIVYFINKRNENTLEKTKKDVEILKIKQKPVGSIL